MTQNNLVSQLVSGKSFEITFKTEFLDTFHQSKAEKIAILATSEYEGIYKNGGIGTYYKNLGEKLTAEGWYVILLLCYTTDSFAGKSKLPEIRHIFSNYEIEQVLNLQPVHLTILSEVRQDIIDYQSFCCLLFTQAIVSCFNNSHVYVEFPEMMGIGYRTVQAKESNLLGSNCITAVTMHSGHEWIYEANEISSVAYPPYFLQACHYEQSSFENADLPFFPSYYLKSKVESYGWKASHAMHMPYFVPIVKLDSSLKNNLPEISKDKIPVVFFGRLEERKGICVFVEAIKLLNSRLKGYVHIIFVGKVVDLNSFEVKHINSQQYIEQEFSNEISYSIISDFYSKEAIQFVSELEQPIVCLTSHQENFPNSALEMGQLPVSLVVSDTGGFRETLELINRSSGVYWFKPKDSHSLCDMLSKALSAYPEKTQAPDRKTIEQVNQTLLAQKTKYIEQAFSRTEITKYNEPKVTIGVTCYNLGKYLMECLTSIDAQTYRNLDVIVIDDASTDEDTQEIFNHARLLFTSYRFIRLDVNIGLGAARNYLVDLAEGDYFLPLDADNILLPFAVEKFLSAACQSNAAIVTCPLIYFGIDNGIRRFTGGSLPSVMRENICGDASSLFAVKFIKKFKHAESKDVLTHDWEIMASAVATGEKIAYYPYPLYEYRMRPDSMLRGAFPQKERYYLRQYLSQIPTSDWSQRQVYMLLMATQKLLESEERAQSNLQLTHAEMERSQSQLQLTHAELERWQSQLQLTHAELERLQSQIYQTQAELEQSQVMITAMESSKFWQLRKAWFRLKKRMGVAGNE